MRIQECFDGAALEALYGTVPHDKLGIMSYHGCYRQKLEWDGEEQSFLFYLPQEAPQSARNVMVLVPDGEEVLEFLEKCGWLDLADREKLVIFGVASLGGWEAQPEENGRWLRKLHELIVNRQYYNIGKQYRYVAAYGDAAAAAESLVLHCPSSVSGLAIIGEHGLSYEELEQLGSGESELPGIPMKAVEHPVVIAAPRLSDRNQDAIRFFGQCNQVEKEPYGRDGMQYYLPDRCLDENWIMSEHTAPVAVWEDPSMEPASPAVAEKVWKELKKYYLISAYGNSSTHACRSMEQMGFIHKTQMIGGYVREWFEYEPLAAKEGTACPMVLVLHGGSGSPELDCVSSYWIHMAKARGFYLFMPYGSLRHVPKSMPHPAWNASGNSADQDDFRFIRYLVEDARKRCQVDGSRIYISGHSMGSAMTQQVILAMPELFAAAASNSGVVRGGFFGGFDRGVGKEHYRMPVIIQMGEKDRGGGTLENNEDARNTVDYWVKRNDAGSVEAPASYKNGPFSHLVFHNGQGVPMVHYITTDHKPHCITPQDPLLYYDEFLCKFSRRPDGTVCYMGKPVE